MAICLRHCSVKVFFSENRRKLSFSYAFPLFLFIRLVGDFFFSFHCETDGERLSTHTLPPPQAVRGPPSCSAFPHVRAIPFFPSNCSPTPYANSDGEVPAVLLRPPPPLLQNARPSLFDEHQPRPLVSHFGLPVGVEEPPLFSLPTRTNMQGLGAFFRGPVYTNGPPCNRPVHRTPLEASFSSPRRRWRFLSPPTRKTE